MSKQDKSDSPPKREFPFKIAPLIVLVVIWNALLLWDIGNPFKIEEFDGFGVPTLLAVLIAFVCTFAVRQNEAMKRLFLKPNHNVAETKILLNLLLFITGFLSFIITIMFVLEMVG